MTRCNGHLFALLEAKNEDWRMIHVLPSSWNLRPKQNEWKRFVSIHLMGANAAVRKGAKAVPCPVCGYLPEEWSGAATERAPDPDVMKRWVEGESV